MRNTCCHLERGQFLTTTDAPALSLVGACRREVGKEEWEGDFSMP